MKLADDITITIAGEDVVLHPALRHAIRLERRPGSFSQLIRDVQDDTLSAAVEIIRDHHDHPALDYQVLDALPRLKGPMMAYIMALTGIDPDDAPTEGKAKGKAVPFSEHLTNLYRLGTGWLGWTPQDTLDATPAEITEAYRGRLEMLKAVFGSGDQADKAVKDDRSLDQKFRSVFAGHQIIREAA